MRGTQAAAGTGTYDACPFLGLPDDRWTHFSFPDEVHRCHAKRKVTAIDPRFQEQFCLTSSYGGCPRFRSAENPLPQLRVAPAAAPSEDTADELPRSREPTPAMTAVTGRPIMARPVLGPTERRSAGRMRKSASVIFLGSLGLAAIAVIALGALGNSPATQPPLGVVEDSPTPSISPSAATDLPSPSPPGPSLSTPFPTVDPTSLPTAAPTLDTPTPTIPDSVVHRVRAGETLAEIAEMYGVTVQAIVRRNDLSDPRLIITGQRLIIPNPSRLPSPTP